jgi:hypothetical protein
MRTRKPLLLGLRANDGSSALGLDGRGGSAGRRLWQLSGMSREEYLAAFDRANVASTNLYGENGASCPNLDDRKVAVLGREAWRLLGLPRTDFFDTEGRFVLLPHPSGRNRLYNSARVRAQARKMLRQMADDHRGGGAR